MIPANEPIDVARGGTYREAWRLEDVDTTTNPATIAPWDLSGTALRFDVRAAPDRSDAFLTLLSGSVTANGSTITVDTDQTAGPDDAPESTGRGRFRIYIADEDMAAIPTGRWWWGLSVTPPNGETVRPMNGAFTVRAWSTP